MYLNKIKFFIHSKKEGKNCMKTTGITRRIDELGRIVIPKEIRKNMHLKTGELLEIFLNDGETITLRKHSIIDKKDEFLIKYVKALADKLKANVYITNLSDVVFSSNEEIIGEKISSELEDLLSNNTRFNNLDTISLTAKKVISKPFYVYQLSPNGDLSGLLIIEYKNNEEGKNEELIKFSTAFLEEYFENN